MKQAMVLGMVLVLLSQTAAAQEQTPSADHQGGAIQEKILEKAKEKMAAIDKNGDGQVDKSEFMEKAEDRFNKTDADGNGVLSPEELKAQAEMFRGKKFKRDGGGIQFP